MSQADSSGNTIPPAVATSPGDAKASKKTKSPRSPRSGAQKPPPAVVLPAATDTVVDLVTMIERLARDPSTDPERLKQFLAVWEHQKANAAEQEFNRAMALAQAEMEVIRADCINTSVNKVGGARYASYAALDAAIRPIYTAHGFCISFDTDVLDIMALCDRVAVPGTGVDLDQLERFFTLWHKYQGNKIRIVALVSHTYVTADGQVAGHTRRYHRDMPADGLGPKGSPMMNLSHAAASADTYGRRLLLGGVFNIAIDKDDDGNAAGGTPARSPDKAANVPPITPRRTAATTVALSPRRQLEADLAASLAAAQSTPVTPLRRGAAAAVADMTPPAATVPPAQAASTETFEQLFARARKAANAGRETFHAFCRDKRNGLTTQQYDSLRPYFGELERLVLDAEQRPDQADQSRN